MATDQYGKYIKGKKKLDGLDGLEEFLVQDADGLSYVVTVTEVAANVELTSDDGEILFNNNGSLEGAPDIIYTIGSNLLAVTGDFSLPDLASNSVPYVESTGILTSSDAMVDSTTKAWTFAHTIEVPGGSIDIGEVTSLSSATGHLIVRDEVLGHLSYLVDNEFDSTGADIPHYIDWGAEYNLDVQLDFSQTLSSNPLIWSDISTVLDPDTRQIVSTTFKTGSVMTNVRAKITDTATGLALRYIPSKYIWDTGVGGITTVAGDNLFDFLSTEDDTPGVYNLGIQPWLTHEAQEFTFEVRADSVDILGDISGDPYQTLIVQDGPHVNLALEDDAYRHQTTGLLEGGLISQASATTVDWTSGRGIVTDYSDPEVPIVTDVTWDAATGITPTNLATDGTTLFGYNSNGVLQQILTTAVSIEDAHDVIWFGSVTHLSSTVVSVVTAPGNIGYNGIGSFSDFINLVIGPANIDGNIYGANGANVNIDVIGGNAYMIGSNFRTDAKLADIITLPSEAIIAVQKVYRSAGVGLSVIYDGLPTTTIDPSQYDDGSGTLQTTTAGYWTIQRIYRGRTGGTFVAYGQEEFASKAIALEVLSKEVFLEKSPLPFTLYRCSLLVVQGATDLSDTAQAEFHAQASFRVTGAQSASSSIPGVTNPGGSDTNIQYNNSSTFGGDSNFSYDDTLKTVVLQSPVAGSATYEFIDSSDDLKGYLRYSETADELSLYATGTTSEIHLNDVAYILRGTVDGRIDLHPVTASGKAEITLSNAGGGTGLSLHHNDLGDDSEIIGEIGNLILGTEESESYINISPDGATGFKKVPTAGYVFDVYANGSDIVGLYSTKGVTLEIGTYGSSDSTNFIFNKGDVGVDQSEFVMFNNNHSTESTRYFRMGYADEIATQGGLNISDANNFVSIGTRTDPDSPLHVYQDDTETGDQCGITIEQDGTGDAVLQYLLTGGQRWVTGISNAGGDAFEIASSINLGSNTRFLINTTGEVKITDSLMVGSESNPASPLHIYQNDILTGADSGITIEQDSTGDAVLHYVLTGIQTVSTGVDYSGSGYYKISGSADLSTDTILTATLAGKVGVGDNDPVSTLHVYDDTTTVGSSIGLTIEQDGTGDALAQWHLTGGVRYLAGIDNSDLDLFKIEYGGFLSTDAAIQITTDNEVGIGVTPDSKLHVYQSDNETGDQAGLTIEQGGTGDAIAQFLLTSGQRWVMGLSNAGGDAFEIASSINLGSDTRFVINTTGEVKITDSLSVGTVSDPVSKLHVYQDDAVTGTSGGITVEQDGGGDAMLQFLLTGGTRWVMGIDNDDDDRFKINLGNSMSTDDNFILDDTNGMDLHISNSSTDNWALASGIEMHNHNAADDTYTSLVHRGLNNIASGILFKNDDYSENYSHIVLGARDANGLEEHALIVKPAHTEIVNSTNTPYGGRGQVQNRLTYSQELDNAVWAPGSTDEPVVTANNAIAPDGTMTADTLSFPGPGAGLIRQGTLGLIEDDTYNVSGWVRHVSGGTQLTARLDTDNTDPWIADSRWQRFSSDIVQGAGGPWFDLFAFAAHTPAVFEVWGLQVSDGAGDKPYLKTEETALLTATTGTTSSGTAYIKGAREVATNGPEVVEVWSLDDMPRVGGTGDVIPDYKLYRFMQGIDWGTTRLKLENDAYALFEGTDVFVTSQTYSGTDPWIYGEGTIRCVGNGMTWQINSDNATMFDITSGGWGMDYSSLIAVGDNCSLGTIVAPKVTNPLLGARFISTRSLFQGFKTGLTLVDPGNIHIDISFFYDATDAVGPMLSVIGMGKAGVIEATEVTMASATSDFLYISPITEAPVTCLGVTLADGQSFFTTGTTGAITLFADASVPAEAVTSVTDNAGIARFNFAAPPTLYVGQKIVMSTFTNYENVTSTITATGAGYYETGVDYNGADTGSFLSDSVTVVSTAHGLSNGDAVLITDTMEYNYGSAIYAVQTNAYQVNMEWYTAETSGTWNDGSLDHSSKYVTSFNNGAQQDSNPAPSFNVADNATTTTTTTGWGAVVFGTAGSALLTGNTNQNFTLIDDVSGLIRYEGIDPLTLKMNPSISMVKTGGAVEHQFRLFKTTGTPTFDPHTVKRSISTSTGAASLNCSAFLNPGDEFRLEVKATTTGSTITITDFSL